MIICLIAKPFHGAAWRTIADALLRGAAALDFADQHRSARRQGAQHLLGAVRRKRQIDLRRRRDPRGDESNKEWRLNWWKTIIGYTFDGPYFWTGKGFGVNLADDDGFQVNADKSLRSPHSVHMTILARMGVPGLVCWAADARRSGSSASAKPTCGRDAAGQQRWAGVMLFLFAYYLAFMINGSFDVFIEGPMGGIWFWSIFGTGVGALVWRYARDLGR